MIVRPMAESDRRAVIDLQDRYDTRWLGAPERDEAEMAEALDHAIATVVVLDGETLVGVAWSDPPRVTLTIDPDVAPQPVVEAVLPWLVDHQAHVDVFSEDDALRTALSTKGFTHLQSSFDLMREAEGGWLAEPTWPAGVTITDFDGAAPEQVHHLIYRDAEWASVPGHVERDLENWLSVFVTERDLPEQQVLAWRDGVLVGAATGRIFADGSGWIAQLAVARSQRRTGLGRALLLEGLRRRVAAGATTVGLGVQAENAGAIALYTGVGLRVVREWQVYAPRV